MAHSDVYLASPVASPEEPCSPSDCMIIDPPVLANNTELFNELIARIDNLNSKSSANQCPDVQVRLVGDSCGFSKRLSAVDKDFEKLLETEPSLLDPSLLRITTVSAPSRIAKYGVNELMVPVTAQHLGSSTPSLPVTEDSRMIRKAVTFQGIYPQHLQERCYNEPVRFGQSCRFAANGAVYGASNFQDCSAGSLASGQPVTASQSVRSVSKISSSLSCRPFGPPTSLKNTTMTSRTNMRLHLMRDQLYEEDRRRREELEAQQHTAQVLPSQPLAINTPPIPPPEIEVPAQIFQVQSRLQNPTQMYVKQMKMRKLQEFMNEAHVSNEQRPVTEVYSLPPGRQNRSAAVNGGRNGENATAPVTSVCLSAPDSPQSVVAGSSVATSVSDVDLDILTLENDGTIELMDGQIGFPNTLPGIGVRDLFAIQDPKTSSSCPADLPPITEDGQIALLTPADLKAFNKDRQKKDNHNMIERRRRCKINDQIQELGKLLPTTGEPYFDLVRDVRRHKGTILTASVSLIKRMKNDVSRMHVMEERIRQLEHNNRKQLLRIQQLEQSAENHGIPLTDTTWQAANIEDIMHMIKREPTSYVKCESVDNNDNHIANEVYTLTHNPLMEDEDNCIISDPMLSSPPEGSISSNNLDDALSPESMDFIA